MSSAATEGPRASLSLVIPVFKESLWLGSKMADLDVAAFTECSPQSSQPLPTSEVNGEIR